MKNISVLLPLFLGVFLFPAVLVPLALQYGPMGLAIIASSMVGVSLVLYTKVALRRRSQKSIDWGLEGMNPPELRLYLIGLSMLAGGIITLLAKMFF